MARPVSVEVVMDDASFVAGSARVTTASRDMGASLVSTNTKVSASQDDLAAITKKTADAQVAAILRVREASKLRISNLQGIASNAPDLETQTAATVALSREQAKLARTYGQTSTATNDFSRASRTAEGDLSKLTRGGLAGTGIFSNLGRSLAFASNAFIGLAVGAEVVKGSITAAENLEKAQASLSVAIQKTGGNVARLQPQYEATAKAAAQFGIDQATATAGLAQATVLTGGAAKAQRAYQEAIVISKATGKDFTQTLTATARAQEGIITSLRRYGILVTKGESGTQQFTQVMARFGGQAEANTTATDKFGAVIRNTGAEIGTVLLPTFVRLTTELSDWLQRMDASGKLQKDVNKTVTDAGTIFHTFEGTVREVDDVTGSFKNTLELLIGLKVASTIASWIGPLTELAAKWGLVAGAATAAETAQSVALAAGGASTASRIILPSGVAAESTAASTGAFASATGLATTKLGLFAGKLGIIAGVLVALQGIKSEVSGYRSGGISGALHGVANSEIAKGIDNAFGQQTTVRGISSAAHAAESLFGIGGASNGSAIPVRLVGAPGFGNILPSGGSRGSTGGPFGTAPVIPIFKSFTDTIGNQLAQARAALTKNTADDVAAAKAEIVIIKREIDKGHLAGASLLQGLQAEASAMSTIQSAQAAAQQKRAAAAQAAAAKRQAQIENSIDPIKLEVALSKAQADNNKKATLGALKALREAARKALASGNLNLKQQKEAYDQITQLNSAITSAAKALGAAAVAQFKQLNLKKETAGLGLTPAQRKILEARLSQVGPKGTAPGRGTGAFGSVIGDNGRPIHVHTTVSIDGKKVASNTTRHQQRRNDRNSSQRRGPNAGDTG